MDLKRNLRRCSKAIAAFKRLLHDNALFSLCVLVGVAVGAIAILLVSLYGLSFWQEAQIVTSITILTTALGLILPLATDMGKRREERKQSQQNELNNRLRELKQEMRNSWTAIDTRLDAIEEKLATHVHKDLAEGIKEILELAVANKAKLEFSYRFDEIRLDVAKIKEQLSEQQQ